jgi:hypothetical protein
MDLLAYLDPGSASALLAAILAGVAGIGAALRTYGKNFFNKLMFWKKDDAAPAAQKASDAADVAEDKPAEQQ